jgi:hypothetical protein
MHEAENWSKSFSQLYSNFTGLKDEDQDRIRIGADDIRDLKRFHCVCRLTVNGEVKDAFIAHTIKDDKRARRDWLEAHPWPVENKNLIIPPVRVPELKIVVGTSQLEQNQEKEETNNISFIPNDEANIFDIFGNDSQDLETTPTLTETATSEKEVYPSIGRVSSKRIEKIVKDLGIEYPQARKWLNEAIVEIERKKIKRGIVNFLKTFLKEKLEKEQIKS